MAVGQHLCALTLPALDLVWVAEVDPATCFGILEVADVIEVLPRLVAESAATALRQLGRGSCVECGALMRPTMVDAIVMALAHQYAASDEVVVHTSDPDDMRTFAVAFPKVIVSPVT